jgi:hypothetical protein
MPDYIATITVGDAVGLACHDVCAIADGLLRPMAMTRLKHPAMLLMIQVISRLTKQYIPVAVINVEMYSMVVLQ